jgi:hypothetical protein
MKPILPSKLNPAILLTLSAFIAACQDRAVNVPSISSTRSADSSPAPDATGTGPNATTSAEYRLDPLIDSDVLADRQTEVWARVYMPSDMSGAGFPVVIILHGNHETCGTGSNPRVDDNCQYTTTGTCPAGYVMAPSYLGFGYLADSLASWGYVVVSINANLGINCGAGITFDDGLVLARGRLILKHLQRLSEWNTKGSTPASLGVELQGKLDFSQLALIGHSRGGEGARAAYALYNDSMSPWPARIPDALTFQGIFEIAPVDGQSFRTLNPDGTKWNVLLPMCDGDISDLEGVKPFDRSMRTFNESPATQKSTYLVWGANHNHYNTEWQRNDSTGCTDNAPLWTSDVGSPNQQQTALFSAMAFIRGNIGSGADTTFNQNFNPQYSLPAGLAAITRVDRGYSDSASSTITTVFEDFTGITGTSSYGFPNDSSGITIMHTGIAQHDPVQRAGRIIWSSPGGYFQTNWTDVGVGNNISSFQTLDLRVSRLFDPLNGPIDSITDFSIQLAQADGTLSSPVRLSSYTNLTGPVGGPGGIRHPILQTARITLTDFTGVDLTQVRGVRLTFDQTSSGLIQLANIRLSTLTGNSAPVSPGLPLTATRVIAGLSAPASGPHSGTIQALRIAAASSSSSSASLSSAVELVVHASDHRFTAGDQLPLLQVGSRVFRSSRYGDGGDTTTLIFSTSAIPAGAAKLQNGNDTFNLGSL